jgi:cytochrome c biogenesis protein CcmG, thiol:disulfide interchange protein DsbE
MMLFMDRRTIQGSGWLAKVLGVMWTAAGTVIFSAPAFAESDWKAFSTPGGQVPPPLILSDLADQTVELAGFRGEVILVNFWATWCEPCREEMPSLNRLQKQLAGKGFRILGVNVGEGKPRIKQFLTRIPVDFRILRDADSDAMKAWRVRVLPASFLIDRKGMLRYQLIGEADWDDPKLRAPILELLQ